MKLIYEADIYISLKFSYIYIFVIHFVYTVKAACIDSHMYRYIGSNDNFNYIYWNFHLIHVTENRVYRQSAVSTNRLYRQNFTIQFRIFHHVYRNENITHCYHIYYSMYDIELSILTNYGL